MTAIHRRTHLPAFLLLFLSQGPDYGAGLLAKMKTELPYFLTDSSNVYRSLQELEERGYVSTEWQVTGDDPPRKWYTITTEGFAELALFYQDIVKRHANLTFFLQHYNPSLNPATNNQAKE